MEGFGLVTVEAAVRGTMVLAADIEGIRDAVIDGQTGFLLPSGRPEEWIERIRMLLDDPVMMRRTTDRFADATRIAFDERVMGSAILELCAIQPRRQG